MTVDQSVSLLKLAALATVGFGLLILSGVVPGLAAPANLLADLVFWPLDDVQAVDSATSRLLAAVTGGVMVGWGSLLYSVVSYFGVRDRSALLRFLTISLTCWYVTDSTGSVLAGAPANAFFNLLFLMMFAVPLFFTWKAERRSG